MIFKMYVGGSSDDVVEQVIEELKNMGFRSTIKLHFTGSQLKSLELGKRRFFVIVSSVIVKPGQRDGGGVGCELTFYNERELTIGTLFQHFKEMALHVEEPHGLLEQRV